MAGDQFRVEELNPFLEWHLHTTATSLEIASEEAKRIAKMIGRKTPIGTKESVSLLAPVRRLQRFPTLPLNMPTYEEGREMPAPWYLTPS